MMVFTAFQAVSTECFSIDLTKDITQDPNPRCQFPVLAFNNSGGLCSCPNLFV